MSEWSRSWRRGFCHVRALRLVSEQDSKINIKSGGKGMVETLQGASKITAKAESFLNAAERFGNLLQPAPGVAVSYRKAD